MNKDSVGIDSINNMTYALYKFALERKSVEEIKEAGYDYSGLVFVIAAVFFGFLIITLDFLIVKGKMRKKGSFFDFGYPTKTNTAIVFFAWSFGSGVLALIGSSANILQATLQSAVIAAVSWIYLASNLIDKYNGPEVPQPTSQE